MKPYTPKAHRPQYQADLNAYYEKYGVMEEIVLEEKGFLLKLYVAGKYIGGEQQLTEALRNSALAQRA